MKDAALAVKTFTPTKWGWTNLLNSDWERGRSMAGLWIQPQTPVQDRTLQRAMRHGACSCPQGSTQYDSTGGPLGNLQFGKKPRAKVTGTGPEMGWGEGGAGRRERQAQEPAVTLCFLKWPGGGVGGLPASEEPRLDFALEPFPKMALGVPSTSYMVWRWRGEALLAGSRARAYPWHRSGLVHGWHGVVAPDSSPPSPPGPPDPGRLVGRKEDSEREAVNRAVRPPGARPYQGGRAHPRAGAAFLKDPGLFEPARGESSPSRPGGAPV